MGHTPSESGYSTESEFSSREQVRREERDGCLFWEVMLKKESIGDKFGFAQVNGRAEFEVRLPAPAQTSEPEFAPDEAWRGPEVLIVRRIHDGGLLHQWCCRHPEAEVFPQDRVCAVNGELTVEGMQREIRARRILLRFMRYPEHFAVTLKKDGRKLGFRIQPSSPQELRITEVLSQGALTAYNRQQVASGLWHYAVLPDMCIESANGVSGDATAIAEELKTCEEVTIRVRRNEHVLFSPQQVRARLKMLAAFGTPSGSYAGSNPATSQAAPAGPSS